ncbi:hypothetical protein [Methylosinus sp. Sm6]|uniref:hypothetical protein n=1 Tax=Methylosinus sp. Sm6 TaxID=2866948 RepID=UPI001C991282|nr:hypothetical protein [Methylosinus sp. Sm6]MBY6240825.1 hypothetical protein [Methylosinus sp. Sm6]
MSVDQELARLLARIFEQTDELLERGETTWETASQGVETVALDLERRYPDQADWIRAQVVEWRRRRAH